VINIVFVLYAAVAVVHLAACLTAREPVRVVSKGFIMPVLLALYILGRNTFQIPMVIAICLGWIGDLILINKKNPINFKLGLASFLLGHIFYIVSMVTRIPSINATVLVISAVLGAGLVTFIFILIKPPQKMRFPIILYELCIVLMSLSALQLLLSYRNIAGIILFAGSVFFLFSDGYLGYYSFHPQTKRFNFVTMLPYIAAQFCIVFGIMRLK
jgi:uncharacterized membrane protein YhhN